MDYVTTDVGLLQVDNANWLFKQNIIESGGLLRNVLVKGMAEKRVQLYSYFRWLVEDIKTKITTPPRQVGIGVDEIITLMRTGSLEIPYELNGTEYSYKANYPVVEKIYDSGRRAFLEKAPNSKGDSFDFSDLDN